MGKPINIRMHPDSIHTRKWGASIHQVGPRYTEFDYACLMANIGKLLLIVNFHWQWQMVRVKLCTRSYDHTPIYINRTISWRTP